MIGYLEGTVVTRHQDAVIVQTVGGVGYRVRLPLPLLAQALEERGTVRFHVVTIVRDDAIALYGFDNQDAKTLFEKLIQVSGVGPKVALAVLSSFSPGQLTEVLIRQDVAALSSVPGIGKKTATRLCVELSDRMVGLAVESESLSGERSDLISALTNMGFPEKDVLSTLQKLPHDDAPFPEQLRMALGMLDRH